MTHSRFEEDARSHSVAAREMGFQATAEAFKSICESANETYITSRIFDDQKAQMIPYQIIALDFALRFSSAAAATNKA